MENHWETGELHNKPLSISMRMVFQWKFLKHENAVYSDQIFPKSLL